MTDQIVVDSYGHEHLCPGPFKSMAEVEQANKRLGHHFFDADTLRFFDSKVSRTLYAGRLFVTSEQFHGSDGSSGPRLYTIRVAGDNGEIQTVGEFQQYSSGEMARGDITGGWIFAKPPVDRKCPLCGECNGHIVDTLYRCNACGEYSPVDRVAAAPSH